ncbi:unnamed protein product, partial [Allacma fusca]
ATGDGDNGVVTDNDVTSNEYLTTSSSVTPVKLSTSTLSSSSSTVRVTASKDQDPPSSSAPPFSAPASPVWRNNAYEAVNLTLSPTDDNNNNNNNPNTSSTIIRTDAERPDEDEITMGSKSKSDFPDLKNETREALQEEGSHHQPVVFVGGSGFIPPNNLRARPILEADPLWNNRPLIDSHYPVPLQSAWDRNYRNPFNMTRVQHIEAECQDDFMKIRVAFNGSFQGLIYSSGYSYDPDCVYVNGTGRDYYEYLIRLNRCGTLGASNHVEGRKEPSKNFMWNTVTVQYNPMIEEEWDEHFKVTCEYGYDFWKTVTFPFLDVEVATGNPVVFTLTPPECYMEVRYGFGAAGTRVGGPVRVGDPLTLMIYMRSQYDGFDIVVNDCYAHNGATKRIQLIDHYGCPVDSKLMSPFRGTWSHTNVYETQVFAYLKTFRFTGSPALYIECDVRMCHGQCPSQPCYWRNVKSVQKRSVDGIESDKFNSTGTLSEKTSLFQALRVLQEDEDEQSALKSDEQTHEGVCLKTGAFTAIIGGGTLVLVILGIVSMILCFRLRRIKEVNETDSDILRPYSHHTSHHHWSASSSLAKPRVS